MSEKKKKKRSLVKMILKRLLFLLSLFVILMGVVTLVFYIKYHKQLNKYAAEASRMVEESTEDSFRQELSGRILYDDGSVISYLKSGKNLKYMQFEDIPQDVIDAFVAVEDRRFYKHKGIDAKGIARVIFNYVRSRGKRMAGASTITQQLARNIFLTHELSLERKVKEAFIALSLEKKYSKEDILEFYINNIYFGNGYYGMGAAAKGYFSKDTDELTLSQTAFLAAIPNNPSHYDPVQYSDRTILRRDKILADMLKLKYISKEEYDEAIAQEIELKQSNSKTNDYETTYAIECAIRYLMQEKGFQSRQFFNSKKDYNEYMEDYQEVYDICRQQVYTSGYDIHTSINKKIQKTLQSEVNSALSFSKDKKNNKVYSFQGAATCIDNLSGKVVAVVGGRKQSSIGGLTLNRAFQSYRQPGSSIKPIAVYTPALENGYTADTRVQDVKLEGGPANSGNAYSGEIPLGTAVQKSKNVVAWQLMEELNPRTGLSYLQDMMFRKILPSDYVNAAALGGLTYGATTEEMAGAYATLANSGIFNEPTCITSIIKDDKEIYKPSESKRIYSAAAAQEMTAILRGVFTKGTAAKLGWGNSSIQAAAKTGTTNDSKDGWFCGYTPYYTIAVWVGYDEPQTMSGLWGSSYPAAIWKAAMTSIIEGKPKAHFDTSSIGGEKNPTKISEYALAHTGEKTISDAELSDINRIVAALNSLENLEAGRQQEADALYSEIEALINGLGDKGLQNDYRAELGRIYDAYLSKDEAPAYNTDDEPIILDDENGGTTDGSDDVYIPVDENTDAADDTYTEPAVEDEEVLTDGEDELPVLESIEAESDN